MWHFSPSLSQFRPIPKASWRMDALNLAALCSGIISWWDPCRSLMQTGNSLEGCPEAGNKNKAECPQELSGRTMFSCWAWWIHCDKHHPPWWSHSFPSDPTGCISSQQRCSLYLKKNTNGKNTSIFKGILDKMANYAQKESETCTSRYMFYTGMFWQMDAFRQRN